jgi:glycosyltransferase involved in cell wall biosynthesis
MVRSRPLSGRIGANLPRHSLDELMRVLHISNGKLYGGQETGLLTLARSRHFAPDIEPHFAFCFEGRLSRELASEAVDTHNLGPARLSRPFTILRSRRRLAELLRRISFDVVICHASWTYAVFAPVVRSAGVRLAFWIHDTLQELHWLDRWAKMTPPDLLIANSHFSAGFATNLFKHPAPEVFYSPVAQASVESPIDRSRLRSDLQTPRDAIVIAQVSRIELCKGHQFHLQALSKLVASPNWICWMIGGAQRPLEQKHLASLKLMATEMGLRDRVRFLDQRSDVSELLAAADIYCQPNIGPESFGISFIEAFQAGLPVVTTALGGAQETVDRSCGILVGVNDAAALASALSTLINDPKLRTRLGAGGRERARQLCDPATQLARLAFLLGNGTNPIPGAQIAALPGPL